jgi:hypothetical protein
MNHIIVFILLLILIAINIIYYYSYNNNIKNHIKENFTDNTKLDYVNSTLTENTNIRYVLNDPLRNCAYYTGLTGKISKFNFDTFSESESIILSKITKIESGFIDKKSEFAYFLTNTQPSIIIKVDLNNFKKEKVMYGVLPPTYDNVHLSVCDSDSKYGYFISTSSFLNTTRYILKVDLAKYNYVPNIDNVEYYVKKHDNPLVKDIPYYNHANTPHIKVGFLAPLTPLLVANSVTLDKIEQNLYFGTNLGIHKYVLNNPNAFIPMPIYSKIFRAGINSIFEQNNPNKIYGTGSTQIKSCIIDDMNQYGFFTTNDSRLLKIDMNAFIEDHRSFAFDNNSLIKRISLAGITETKNIIIDSDNKYLYGDSNNGKIFKLDINSNTINVLDLSSKKSNMYGGLVIDKENRYLYSTNIDANNYIFKIKIKDYFTPTEEVQTNDSEIIISTTSSGVSRTNVLIDEISAMQNSINSIVNENDKTIKSDLDTINTEIDNVLKQQSVDHDKILNSVNLTIDELNKTKNVIDLERAKINLKSDEPYLLKDITPSPNMQIVPISTPTQEQEQFANLIQNRVHPRINDFINIQPDWRVEWNKNMHNANINPLLVLP